MAIKRKLGNGDNVHVNNTNIGGQVIARVEYYRGHTEMLVRFSTGNSFEERWVNEQQLTAIKASKKKTKKKVKV